MERIKSYPYFYKRPTKADQEAEKAAWDASRDAGDAPAKLYFEISSLCNLDCRMCFRHTWIDESTGLLDSRVFYESLEDEELMSGVHTIFFGGMGEPFTHPELVEMTAAAHKKGKRVELITNGTMLTRAKSEALLEAGLDLLWISVDGFSIEAYENIRVNSKFDLVTRNLAGFNEARRKSGRTDCRIGVTFVASKSNVDQLLLLPDFMDRFEIDEVNISNMIPNSPELESEVLYDNILMEYMVEHDERLSDFHRYNIVVMDLKEPGVREGYEKLLPYLSKSRIPEDREIMKNPWCRFVNEGNVFVSWDGDVVPCMALLHSSYTYLHGDARKVMRHAYGNIYKQSLLDIWRSAEYTDFRKRVKDFSFSPCISCGGCELRGENAEDCLMNPEPTCGACLWAYNYAACP